MNNLLDPYFTISMVAINIYQLCTLKSIDCHKLNIKQLVPQGDLGRHGLRTGRQPNVGDAHVGKHLHLFGDGSIITTKNSHNGIGKTGFHGIPIVHGF